MTEFLCFEVLGVSPVPWTVPTSNRTGGVYRPKKSCVQAGQYSMADWQTHVHAVAVEAMARAGIDHPLLNAQLRVDYVFYAETSDERMVGKIWPVTLKLSKASKKGKVEHKWIKVSREGKTDPDITNIVKSTEDAMEDAVFVNDAVVRQCSVDSRFWWRSGVKITVSVLGPEDGLETGGTEGGGD